MYKNFYGLKEKPFEITPDPNFLYLSPGHREALAHLTYAVRERVGFTVITGEVGTGQNDVGPVTAQPNERPDQDRLSFQS